MINYQSFFKYIQKTVVKSAEKRKLYMDIYFSAQTYMESQDGDH